MAVIGVPLENGSLVLTKGRDFKWVFENLSAAGVPTTFPPGQLFLELGTSPVTKWQFSLSGTKASLKVESEEVNKIPRRTRWQLVFLATGEAAGGDPLARGTVRLQE